MYPAIAATSESCHKLEYHSKQDLFQTVCLSHRCSIMCIINSNTTASRIYARQPVYYTITAYVESCIIHYSTAAGRIDAGQSAYHTVCLYFIVPNVSFLEVYCDNEYYVKVEKKQLR